jgi:hypothetical protein
MTPLTDDSAPDEGRNETDLTEAILAYLAERPHATDTVEGIAKWWLMRQRVRIVVARVEEALGKLTGQGKLESVGVGSARRYRLRESAVEPSVQ